MPRTPLTPQQRAANVRKQVDDAAAAAATLAALLADPATQPGDRAVLLAAQTLEKAGCYIRRNG